MDSPKCQTVTVSPAKPGDFPSLVKMIAYRAETALANRLSEHLSRPHEARRMLCALYTTDADLLPDPAAGTLTVRLHHGANAANDLAIEKLCEKLNATGTVFPRTSLRHYVPARL